MSNNNIDKYEKKFITFTIEQASLFYIRLLGVLLLTIVLPFIIINFESFQYYFSNLRWTTLFYDILFFISTIIVGIFLHEVIHGITWSLFVKQGLRAIKLGIIWKPLIPYCHCKGYLKVKHYITGAIMPAILLGILPIIWAFITVNVMLLLLGVYFTVAASGDFLIIYLLRKERYNNYIKDHDTKPGCIVYYFKD